MRTIIRKASKAAYQLFFDKEQFKKNIKRDFHLWRRGGLRAIFPKATPESNISTTEEKKKDKPIFSFPESALAHKYCIGKGLEIGGCAHNPFGLNTQNVDFTDSTNTVFKQEEIRLCGKALKVDIVASGDDIPLPDESQDFIVSSHVIEHFPNPIKALIEWDRLVRPGGIIFMIVPHKERTFDKGKENTLLEHLIKDFKNNNTNPHVYSYGHDHCWITESFMELINYIIQELYMKWEIVEVQDVDDKVGNGFTVVVRKIGTRGYRKNKSINESKQNLQRSFSHSSVPLDGEQLPPLKKVFCSVTDRCNLSCKMCPRKNLYYDYADIDTSILQRVYEKAPDLYFVGLHGYGEPYLYDGLYEVIETLKALMAEGGEIGFNTNATLLGRHHIVRTVESGLDNLTFSIDGATRATYEKIRKGAKFDQIIKNIKDFVHYKKQAGSNHPKLMMNYVIMEDNIQEIPLFVELSKQCGINAIHFNYDRTSYGCLQTDELKEAFQEAKRKAEELQIILYLPPIYPVKSENEFCVFMNTAVLLNSGEVVPCCHAAEFDLIGNPENILSFGNVKENSFDDIWNSRSYISFRRKVLSKNWPRFCNGCGFKSQIFM